jgi:hypothetical protein
MFQPTDSKHWAVATASSQISFDIKTNTYEIANENVAIIKQDQFKPPLRQS